MELNSKLARAIGMMSKVRHYVSPETLRQIYYGIFSSILMYGSQIWGQHNTIVSNLQKLQNKALRTINFAPFRSSATPLFKKCEILKLTDNIILQNFLYAHDSLKGNLARAILGKLALVNTVNNTRNETYFQLERIRSKTILYGTNSIRLKSIEVWNFINRMFHSQKLYEKSRAVCKKFVKKFLIDRY